MKTAAAEKAARDFVATVPRDAGRPDAPIVDRGTADHYVNLQVDSAAVLLHDPRHHHQ